MKKFVSIILLIAVGIGIGIVVPNFFTGEVEAANNKDIVGTWIRETGLSGNQYYDYFQFKEDGTGLYTTAGGISGTEYKVFNYSYNGKELIIDGVKVNCSISGNGMFLYYSISEGKVKIIDKPYVYVRA